MAVFGAALLFMGNPLVGQTIDLAGDGTLKAVFAAGLRPFKYGESLDRYEIADAQITLLLPDGKRSPTFPQRTAPSDRWPITL